MNRLELQQIDDLISLLNYTIENDEKFTINKKVSLLLIKYIKYLKGGKND